MEFVCDVVFFVFFVGGFVEDVCDVLLVFVTVCVILECLVRGLCGDENDVGSVCEHCGIKFSGCGVSV